MDIMVSAFHGATYWMEDMKVSVPRGEDKRHVFFSDGFKKGYKMKVYDLNSGKWHAVSRATLLRGLRKCPKFDYVGYDNLNAEAVLQIGIFGKQLYS